MRNGINSAIAAIGLAVMMAGCAETPKEPLTCEGAQFVCNGACTSSSKQNCGSCDNACPGEEQCQNGNCGCPPGNGTSSCASTDGKSVVCSNTLTDEANCGSCGNACTGGKVCSNGECKRICDEGLTLCGASCVDVLGNDVKHCGACGRVCSANHIASACTGGTCTGTCEGSYRDCNSNKQTDGCEVDIETDNANCGACGARCVIQNGVGQCQAGKCTIATCNPGFDDCDGNAQNGCEVDLKSNLAHCGMCKQVCNPANGFGVCANAACVVAGCQPGYEDCDGKPGNGCEIDATSDVKNCGACRLVCPQANGTAGCNNGTCEVGKCNAGFADCNGEIKDGCETDLRSDASHCGTCARVCVEANGVASCSNGLCAIGICYQGFGDCNVDALDGCEINLNSNKLHCSKCGSACKVDNGTPACQAGACAIATCFKTHGDCDGDPANGCEANITTSDGQTGMAIDHCGACGKGCDQFHPVCSNGSCTATCSDNTWDGKETDVDCGGGLCNKCQNLFSCLSGRDCVSGYCDPFIGLCTPGPTCSDLARNGSETDINCGGGACPSCGFNKRCLVGSDCLSLSCSNITHLCLAPTCGDQVQNGAESDADCGGGGCPKCGDGKNCRFDTDCISQVCTNGVCQAPTCSDSKKNGTETDRDCGGSCPNKCSVDPAQGCAFDKDCLAGGLNAAPKCFQNVCVFRCDSGYADCDGDMKSCEVNLGNDPLHCGTCKATCSVGNGTPKCDAGKCGVDTCKIPYSDCDGNAQNGCEVNTGNNTNHCNACGNACSVPPNAASICSNGSCNLGSCKTGWANCDGDIVNGCEKNLNTDSQNCGSCGKVCNFPNASSLCINGGCTIACKPGYADCNGVAQDGCEANLTNSITNCGACGMACDAANGTPICNVGVCGLKGCAKDFADCNQDAKDGCESNLPNDAKNCGGCGRVCTVKNGTPGCSNSLCKVALCDLGFDDCDGNVLSGCETNLRQDANHCGACGKVCNLPHAVSFCSDAQCGIASCAQGWSNCNGSNADGCETQGPCMPMQPPADMGGNGVDGGAVDLGGPDLGGGPDLEVVQDMTVVRTDMASPDLVMVALDMTVVKMDMGPVLVCVDVPLPKAVDAGASDGGGSGDGGVVQLTERVCGEDKYGKMNAEQLPIPVGGFCLGPLTDNFPDNVDYDCDCGVAGAVIDASSRSRCPDVCPHAKLWAGDCDDSNTGLKNRPGEKNWCDAYANSCQCGPGITTPDIVGDTSVCPIDPNSGKQLACNGHGTCQ